MQINLFTNTVGDAKPFLKWAGGKRKVIKEHLSKLLPIELSNGKIKNYYEPFLGGGAMFFYLSEMFQFDKVRLSDVNKDLILTYQAVCEYPLTVFKKVVEMRDRFLKMDEAGQRQYYESVRKSFNEDRFDFNYTYINPNYWHRASKFIFLNKTNFNGLYRVNKSGEYNTSFGFGRKESMVDIANLSAVSKTLKSTILKDEDFRLLKNINENSFVYLDPPYRPLIGSPSFKDYDKSGFNDDTQKELASVFHNLDKQGAKIMLSNSFTGDGFFEQLYDGFKIHTVYANRTINRDGNKRGKVKEIVVTNY